MRKLAVAVVLLAYSASAGAISNPNLKPSFADLTWYSNRNAVRQQMVSKGYVFEREVRQNGTVDSIYSGALLGIPVEIQHWFNNKNQIVKTTVVFKNNYSSNLYSDWSSIKSNVDGKYGLGLNLSDISSLAKETSVMLEADLDSGKNLSNAWLFTTYKYGIFLAVDKAYSNNSNYYIVLSYESPAWDAEVKRRRQSSDF